MKGQLRVVHFASGDLWAGAEVQLFELCRALSRSEQLDVRVVLLNEGMLAERLRALEIPVTLIPERELGGFAISRRLISILRDWRPHVLHTHRQKENVLGSIAGRLAGVRCSVRTVHGAPEFGRAGLRRRINHGLNRLTARWLQHGIIMVTHELSQQLQSDYPNDKMVVIENGISPPEIHVSNTRRFAKAGKVNVCFAGRLVPVKRIDVFAGIAKAALDASESEFHFHVFGDGPLERDLARQIERDDSSELISCWGFVDGLVEALAEMDLLIMTSDHEGLPMVMLEAMAVRVPVVAHAVGGMPEVLDDGACGVLVTQQTSNGFLEAIQPLAAPERRDQLSRLAHQRFTDRYTAAVCAKRTHELYRNLVV